MALLSNFENIKAMSLEALAYALYCCSVGDDPWCCARCDDDSGCLDCIRNWLIAPVVDEKEVEQK